MANPQVNQEEFVDLYEALNLPQNADVEKIRKRINALYLEAQQNLDHRNAKKRLQYQQLYEILLPQARHLLLDEGRRSEYDRYLTAFKTGTKVTTTTQEAAERHFSTSKPTTVTERLKEEEGVDPEKLAEQREDMWAQWKHGLEQVVDEPSYSEETAESDPLAPKANIPSPTSTSTPKSSAAQPSRAPELRRAGQETEEGHHGFSSAALQGGSQRLSVDAKRQQDQQRAKMIERAANNSMFPRGLMVGVPVFLVCSGVFYFATNYLTSNGYLIGTIGEVANLGWGPLAIVIAYFQGRGAAESARQDTISKLSKYSFDELKKRGLK